MITEGLLTTTDGAGAMHLAPMGPRLDLDAMTLELRPFPSSASYRNLVRRPEGVFHTTDDVLLLACAGVGAVGRACPAPESRAAGSVAGFVLAGACHAYEFRVESIDESQERVSIRAKITRHEMLREMPGFNRAKAAIVEAAILATRLHLIPAGEVAAEFARLAVIVRKTGGPAELAALAFLDGVRRGEP